MNDNQILVIHSRGVYNFMGKLYNCISLFCYDALLSKIGSDLGTFFQLCTNKIPIQFALYEMNTKT